MQLIKIFAQANTQFDAVFTDGSIGKRQARHDLGLIEGTHRDMTVIIADNTGFDGMGFDYDVGSQDDCLHVVNVYRGHGKSSRYIDTVAVAGAMDVDHAISLAVNQFDSMDATYGIFVANEPEKPVFGLDGLSTDEFRSLGFSADTLNKHLSHHSQNQHFLPIITQKQLLAAQSQVTTDEVMWDGFKLLSHGGDDTRLLIDLKKNDALKELVTQFDMAEALAELNITGELGFDALMDTNNRLQMMADRLFAAMSKASIDDLSVTNVTLSKPFKRNGVANVAMQFDLSDGQAIVIWFHNPDADPKKLSPGDTMVSWKWMLNKRDITAAVSPKNGENVRLGPLAMRMMRVAAKNSKRFAAAQATKAKNQQALTDAEADVAQKQATLEQLDMDIAELTKKIDEATQAQAEQAKAQPEPTANTAVSEVVQPATETNAPTTAEPAQEMPANDTHIVDDLLAMGLNIWEKAGNKRIYMTVKQFNEITGYNYTLNDSKNKIFYDFKTNAIMRSYNGKAPKIEVQYTAPQDTTTLDVSNTTDTNENVAEPTIAAPAQQTAELTPEEVKLNAMLKEQEMMKAVNKIVRTRGLNERQKAEKIAALGYYSEQKAADLAHDDGTYFGGAGFKPFELTNLNARIKSQRQRVETAKKVEAINNNLDGEDMELAGVTISLDKEDNRIRLYFPGKPSDFVRGLMKKHGWKWSPKNNAWQRQLTDRAINDAKYIIGQYAEDEGIDMDEESNTTPANETPAQNNGFSYEEAHALDGDYIGTFKDDSDIFKATEGAKEKLSEKGYPAWAIAATNGDYVGVFALPDDEYSSGEMQKSAEAAYSNMLTARENIMKYPDGNNSAVLAANENTAPAEPTPPINSGNHPPVINKGTSDEMRFVGENSEGTPIYENKDGVRYLSEFGGIMFTAEPSTLGENGATRLPREDNFMTKAELAAKDNTTAQDNNDHPDYTQVDLYFFY